MGNISNLFKMGGEVDFGKTKTTAISVIGLLMIFALWYLISKFEIITTNILPDPISVICSYGSLFENNHLLANAWFSIRLNWMSYFWAILIALPVGFIIGLFPINNIIIGRYIDSVRYLPIPALSGIFFAVFGLTFEMKQAFLAFAIIIYIVPTVVTKINRIQSPSNDSEFVYLQSIKTLGASSWQKFKEVYLPYVCGSISTDIINLTGITWSYLVICELFYKDSTISGLGSLISTMSRQSHMAEVYALLFLIVVIGILQDVILKFIDKKLFPWKY
jgi:NitT/TauT family transport system permease protein